mmetsp:Transcript_127834/g.355734  ORF Transcript_127834/g.355734 Transcript_127834/m.355734 type:complete len:425 (-) Transcript_127834:89-1363(-)|eukprot:CAMPEP_0179045502 /NCGR_PEP_ID=MMETSP0796-20121207/18210_1 /TAXON_ID=73915 /ORGANISM="Pyrodinium bahamense, Strain pbaha01" /LENGTH=424 /DNA_ID=CAMNT_0020741909 /DNA_START=77 /DNA_END=1351 /DNA_ORIENTATION=-
MMGSACARTQAMNPQYVRVAWCPETSLSSDGEGTKFEESSVSTTDLNDEKHSPSSDGECNLQGLSSDSGTSVDCGVITQQELPDISEPMFIRHKNWQDSEQHVTDAAEPLSEEANMPDGVPLTVVPSVGSARHILGDCRPCLFFLKESCRKGEECLYCHIGHQELMHKRIRPSKKTRKRRERRKAEEEAMMATLVEAIGAPPGLTLISDDESGPVGDLADAGAAGECSDLPCSDSAMAKNRSAFPRPTEHLQRQQVREDGALAGTGYQEGKAAALHCRDGLPLPLQEESGLPGGPCAVDAPRPAPLLREHELRRETPDASTEPLGPSQASDGELHPSVAGSDSDSGIQPGAHDWRHQIWEDTDTEVDDIAASPRRLLPIDPVVTCQEEMSFPECHVGASCNILVPAWVQRWPTRSCATRVYEDL